MTDAVKRGGVFPGLGGENKRGIMGRDSLRMALSTDPAVTVNDDNKTPTLTALTRPVVAGDWVMTFSNAAVNLAVV